MEKLLLFRLINIVIIFNRTTMLLDFLRPKQTFFTGNTYRLWRPFFVNSLGKEVKKLKG